MGDVLHKETLFCQRRAKNNRLQQTIDHCYQISRQAEELQLKTEQLNLEAWLMLRCPLSYSLIRPEE